MLLFSHSRPVWQLKVGRGCTREVPEPLQAYTLSTPTPPFTGVLSTVTTVHLPSLFYCIIYTLFTALIAVFITHVRLEDRIPFNPLQVIKHFLRIVTLSKLFEFWALYSFGLFLDLNNQVNIFFIF